MDVQIPIDATQVAQKVDDLTRPATCPWEALERIARMYPNSAPALIARSALARKEA